MQELTVQMVFIEPSHVTAVSAADTDAQRQALIDEALRHAAKVVAPEYAQVRGFIICIIFCLFEFGFRFVGSLVLSEISYDKLGCVARRPHLTHDCAHTCDISNWSCFGSAADRVESGSVSKNELEGDDG